MSSPNTMLQVAGKMVVTRTPVEEVWERMERGGESIWVDPPSRPARDASEKVWILRSAVQVARKFGP